MGFSHVRYLVVHCLLVKWLSGSSLFFSFLGEGIAFLMLSGHLGFYMVPYGNSVSLFHSPSHIYWTAKCENNVSYNCSLEVLQLLDLWTFNKNMCVNFQKLRHSHLQGFHIIWKNTRNWAFWQAVLLAGAWYRAAHWSCSGFVWKIDSYFWTRQAP